MAAAAATPLTASSWMLQVKGIPWASTNADMHNNFSKAISMFQGTPFLFAFLHNDPSKSMSDNTRLPQQALLHFSSLQGARSAQSCLWKTAEHYQNEWAWFLTGAETHILERRVLVKQLDPTSQAGSVPVLAPTSVHYLGTVQSMQPVQADTQGPMIHMSLPALHVSAQNGTAAGTRNYMQQPDMSGVPLEPAEQQCPGTEVSSHKHVMASQQQPDLGEALLASIPPPPSHELAASSVAVAIPLAPSSPSPAPSVVPPPPQPVMPSPPPPEQPPPPPPEERPPPPPVVPPPPPPLPVLCSASAPTPPSSAAIPPLLPPLSPSSRPSPLALQPAAIGPAANLEVSLPLAPVSASPSPATQTSVAHKAQPGAGTESSLAVTSPASSLARVAATLPDGSQAVTLARNEGHTKEAVVSLKQQCMGREQHKEEVLHLVTAASSGGSGLLSNHQQAKSHMPKAVDKQASAARLHQHAAGNVENHESQAINASCKGISQPALQKEPDHRRRDKADADRDKHKQGSCDLSRQSSRESSRELDHHYKEHRHDKSSQSRDRSTHRHYDDSSVRHGKYREHSMSENQSKHGAHLSSRANGRRSSSGSLSSSRHASKDDKRHQHSSKLGRPRSGSYYRKRSRSPHERNHNRSLHQRQ